MAIRRAAIAATLLLAACTAPRGIAVEECDTSWRGLDPQIVRNGSDQSEPVPIACMRRVDERRISIGFEMPPGPDCYELAAVELEESADVVAVTLHVSLIDDVGGSCPTEPVRTVTEVDLQAPVGERALLDGSR